MAEQPPAGRILGIGGIFFKSSDPSRLGSWYTENLGIAHGPSPMMFHWRSHEDPDAEHFTVWSIFEADSTYFDPSNAPFMINYIVADLAATLCKLARTGGRVHPKPGRLGLCPVGGNFRPGRKQDRVVGAAPPSLLAPLKA